MSIGEVWLATQIPPFLGLFSLSVLSGLREAFPDLSQHSTEGFYSRVVIADGGGESTGTDPEAHHMDPFAEPRLYPKPQPHTATHVKESKFHQEILWNSARCSPWVWKESNGSGSNNQPGEANASQQDPTESTKCCWWKWRKVNIQISKSKTGSLGTKTFQIFDWSFHPFSQQPLIPVSKTYIASVALQQWN